MSIGYNSKRIEDSRPAHVEININVKTEWSFRGEQIKNIPENNNKKKAINKQITTEKKKKTDVALGQQMNHHWDGLGRTLRENRATAALWVGRIATTGEDSRAESGIWGCYGREKSVDGCIS